MDVTIFLLMISSVAPTPAPTSSPEGDCTDVFSKESVQVSIYLDGVSVCDVPLRPAGLGLVMMM